MEKKVLIAFLFFLLFIPGSKVYAEHVLGVEAYGQFLDISQLEAEKSSFEFDGISYDLYYGYHGSMDDSMSDELGDPTVKEVNINQEKKSIEVTFEEVPERTDFWVRIPFEVLTAEKEKYQLLINDVDSGYDIMKMPDGYVIGMIIPEDTKKVEIIGTKVIPEFGVVSILVLGTAIMGTVYIFRQSSLGSHWTSIN